MFNKLLTALLLVLAVLYIGDPYSEKNQALAPYLPPAPTDSEIAELRDSASQLATSIKLDDIMQTVSDHPLTHSLLAAIEDLRLALIDMLIDYTDERQLLAQAKD
ncbi:MAG: hypothetical protein KDJ38_00465 [Gammaproteobacteria bacterium]|nr:hypothetical protein [Gammaproteobacteria bacterium]